MSEFQKIGAIVPQMSKVTNSLLDEIKGNEPLMKELESLGVQEEEIPFYIPLLANYLDSKKTCEFCKGYDKCDSDSPHMCRYLSIGSGGTLSSYLGPCPLAKNELLKESNYLYRDFDPSLKSISTKTIKTERNSSVLSEILSTLKETSSYRFAYLHGPSGSGKTYLLAALCNDLALKNKQIAFIDVNRRFNELREYSLRDRPRFERSVDALKTTPILVLDGFGNEFRSDTVRDVILLPLIEYRSKNRLPTFFTSEYSLSEIETLYSKSRADALVAKRLVNHIRKNIKEEIEVPMGLETFFNGR